MKVKLIKEIEFKGVLCPINSVVEMRDSSAEVLIANGSAVEDISAKQSSYKGKHTKNNGNRR